MVTYHLLFHLFTTFSPITHGPKITSISKIYLSTWKSSLSKVNFSPRWINTIGRILLYTVDDSPVCFTIIANIVSSNPIPRMVVPFLVVPLHWQAKLQARERKSGRQKLRNFKHKGNHKIGFYPQYLLIFTAYQVQGWWTVIISLVKSQPYGSNVIKLYSRAHCTHT